MRLRLIQYICLANGLADILSTFSLTLLSFRGRQKLLETS